MRPKRRATKLLNKLAALTMFVPTLAEIQEAAERERRYKIKKSNMELENGPQERRIPKIKIEGASSSSDSGMDDKRNQQNRTLPKVKSSKFSSKKSRVGDSTLPGPAMDTEDPMDPKNRSKIDIENLVVQPSQSHKRRTSAISNVSDNG